MSDKPINANCPSGEILILLIPGKLHIDNKVPSDIRHHAIESFSAVIANSSEAEISVAIMPLFSSVCFH